MFGDGTLAACKPISEADLAAFIADCVTEVGGRGGGAGWQAPGDAGALRRRGCAVLPPRYRAVAFSHAGASCDLPQKDKVNQVLPIGGPGKALTALDQAQLLFDAAGVKPFLFPVRPRGGVAWRWGGEGGGSRAGAADERRRLQLDFCCWHQVSCVPPLAPRRCTLM